MPDHPDGAAGGTIAAVTSSFVVVQAIVLVARELHARRQTWGRVGTRPARAEEPDVAATRPFGVSPRRRASPKGLSGSAPMAADAVRASMTHESSKVGKGTKGP